MAADRNASVSRRRGKAQRDPEPLLKGVTERKLQAVKAPDETTTPFTLRLLGPFEALVNGVPLPRLHSRKGHWLLALLALRAGRELERDWLACLLWPDSPEAEARASLRNSLADLRRALGPAAARLQSPTRRTLCLDLAGAAVDVRAFDAALARGQERSDDGGASLEQAVALYRGPLLEDCAEEWAFEERQRYGQAYLTARETLAAQALAAGDPAAAERHLRLAVATDPLRESAQRALMQALAAGGSYAAALLVYRDLRQRLHREIHAEPDPETQALFQQIRAEAREKAGVGHRVSGVESGPSDTRHPMPDTLLAEDTVTFLFTDIEGSTQLWERHPAAARNVFARHDALLRQAIEAHGGRVFKTVGDQLCAAFATAPSTLAAALAGQSALQAEPWGEVGALRVRMALHTGAAEEREEDYFGPALSRVARLLAAGHGGQVLLSQATCELVRDALPEGVSLLDLGEHRLKDLQQPVHLFQLSHPALPADFPPVRSLQAWAHNLPVQLTRFIGREQAIAEVKERLAATHLLTLTGAGGCGKTRLALQMAADLVDEYPDGVRLVELAPLADPALVPLTATVAFGLWEQPGRSLTQTLVDYLRPRSLLLLLDNCEHLLGSCAQLADTLLRACPDLRILATSREGLGIAGETAYRVPPLSLPDPGLFSGAPGERKEEKEPPGGDRLSSLLQSEAVTLFTDRALAVLPNFSVTNENATAVVEVCRRLGGIPLAIELAAARVKALPVPQIASRLDDVFRLLTGGSRTALPRQQTLRALIDWSYDLLSEPERALLRRLSVFAGGWTLEAAEAVCSGEWSVVSGEEPRSSATASGSASLTTHHPPLTTHEVLDLLTQLVEKSLVGYEPQEGEARYRLLETVRQYGWERLRESGEEEAVRRGHRDYFLALAEEAEPLLRGPQQKAWIDRLEREHDNLRAALEWSFTEEGGAEAALRLTAALGWFWWVQTHWWAEAWKVFARAAERRHCVSEEVRVKVCVSRMANPELLEEGLALSRALGDMRHGACALLLLAGHAWGREEYEAAQVWAEEGLVLARESGDKVITVDAHINRGMVALYLGQYELARSHSEQALTRAREIGDRWAQAFALNRLGMGARGQGEYATARAFHEESLAIRRELDDRRGLVSTLMYLGDAALEQEDEELARRCCAESVRIGRDMGDGGYFRLSLIGLGQLARRAEDPRRAARLWGAAEDTMPLHPAHQAAYERDVAAVRAALGEEAFATAWAEGRAMTFEQVAAYALEEIEPSPSRA
jgi:predicted ATPase/DNA-binding SARP family transcriptional activator